MHDNWHRGDWMETFSGRKFFPFDPKPEDVDLRDIAHHLAMICRYGGASKFHYSVAQHSVLVAQNVSRKNKLRALLHDAPEYITGDMIRPIKKSGLLQGFHGLELGIEFAICNRFCLPHPICNDEIKLVDDAILTDERKHVMSPSANVWWTPGDRLRSEPTSLGIRIEQWTPERAEQEFLAAYDEYSQLDIFPEGA